MYRTIKTRNSRIVIHDIPNEMKNGKPHCSIRSVLLAEHYAREVQSIAHIHYQSYKEVERQYGYMTTKELITQASQLAMLVGQ